MEKKPISLLTFIFMYVFLFHQSYGQEPVCSRFSYEQSTLEKMIHTEIKVAEMERELKKTAESIRETEKRVTRILDEITSQSAQTTDFLNLKESQMKILIENLSKFKNNTAEELKDMTSPVVVTFQANTIDDKSLATDQTLVFASTIVNIGGGYDNHTGYFTAPVKGMYQLSVQLCTVKAKYIHFDIVVGSHFRKSGVFYDATANTCASADVGMVMETGTIASIRCSYGYTHDVLYETRYRMNIFSGYLVYRLPD